MDNFKVYASFTEKQGFGYPWLSNKKFHTHPLNPLKPSSRLEILATNLFPLTGLGQRPIIQILASMKC